MKKAFTLIELIVVITILSILATIAVISYDSEGVEEKRQERIREIQKKDDERYADFSSEERSCMRKCDVINSGYRDDNYKMCANRCIFPDFKEEVGQTSSSSDQSLKYLENSQKTRDAIDVISTGYDIYNSLQ